MCQSQNALKKILKIDNFLNTYHSHSAFNHEVSFYIIIDFYRSIDHKKHIGCFPIKYLWKHRIIWTTSWVFLHSVTVHWVPTILKSLYYFILLIWQIKQSLFFMKEFFWSLGKGKHRRKYFNYPVIYVLWVN